MNDPWYHFDRALDRESAEAEAQRQAVIDRIATLERAALNGIEQIARDGEEDAAYTTASASLTHLAIRCQQLQQRLFRLTSERDAERKGVR